MKRSTLALSLVAVLSLGAVAAHAESPDPSGQFAHSVTSTRTAAEVRSELLEAQRNGDVVRGGESGLTDSQARPWAYAPRATEPGKSVAQVRAETLEAIQSGDILQAGESGLTRRQVSPHTYYARDRGMEQHRTAGTRQQRMP